MIDNGKEFAQHERIAARLDAQFFPKEMAFDNISSKDIALAMHSLNHRPRQCLNFKIPA